MSKFFFVVLGSLLIITFRDMFVRVYCGSSSSEPHLLQAKLTGDPLVFLFRFVNFVDFCPLVSQVSFFTWNIHNSLLLLVPSYFTLLRVLLHQQSGLSLRLLCLKWLGRSVSETTSIIVEKLEIRWVLTFAGSDDISRQWKLLGC